jgi:hypothetical protein
LHVGRARKSQRDTRNTTIYTGSGLQRVKPYIQFGGGIIRDNRPRGGSRRLRRDDRALEGGAPGRLILAGVPWVTSQFPSILVGYDWESLSKLDYLVLYSKYLYVLGLACQVGPACRGRLRSWSVGTHGYPCLSSPRSTCRRSGRDEVMSKRSEGMAPLRSRRVHRDQKKKNPSNACMKSNIELLKCRSRRSK